MKYREFSQNVSGHEMLNILAWAPLFSLILYFQMFVEEVSLGDMDEKKRLSSYFLHILHQHVDNISVQNQM